MSHLLGERFHPGVERDEESWMLWRRVHERYEVKGQLGEIPSEQGYAAKREYDHK